MPPLRYSSILVALVIYFNSLRTGDCYLAVATDSTRHANSKTQGSRFPATTNQASATILQSAASSSSSSVESSIRNMHRSRKWPNIRVLGVCGSIGSGKSAACKILVNSLGCAVHFDADSIAHAVYQPGQPCVDDIVREFGEEVLNKNENDDGKKSIDRKKLGAIVFQDREAMKRLERIVWPRTRDEIVARIEAFAKESHEKEQNQKDSSEQRQPLIVIVEAAVLLDAEWNDDFLDAVWVVTASPAVALQRLMEQRGLTQQDAESRIKAQTSRRGIGNLNDEVSRGVVTAVIDNSSTLEDLQTRLAEKLVDSTAWYAE